MSGLVARGRAGVSAGQRRVNELRERYGDRALVDLGLRLYRRDRESAGTVVGAAVALRLFLFFVPLLLFVVGLLGIISSWVDADDVNEQAGVTGSLASQINTALSQPESSRWFAIVAGLLGIAWTGRSHRDRRGGRARQPHSGRSRRRGCRLLLPRRFRGIRAGLDGAVADVCRGRHPIPALCCRVARWSVRPSPACRRSASSTSRTVSTVRPSSTALSARRSSRSGGSSSQVGRPCSPWHSKCRHLRAVRLDLPGRLRPTRAADPAPPGQRASGASSTSSPEVATRQPTSPAEPTPVGKRVRAPSACGRGTRGSFDGVNALAHR